jgi:hypothetical protein
LCAIRYGGCGLGYQVVSDTEVKILRQVEKRAWDGFPSKNFPATLPARPMDLLEAEYDRDCPQDVFLWSGVFGVESRTPKQFKALVKFVVKHGLYDPECTDESAEEYMREGTNSPFLQGVPNDPCPNPKCRRRRKRSALRPFAIFQEDDATNMKKLWDGGDVQVIYQICPECQSILATNQCE